MGSRGEGAGGTAVRRLAVSIAVVGAVVGIGFLLLEDIGRGGRSTEPPAVIFSAPAGYRMEEGGDLSRPEAARRLAAALEARAAEPLVGLHFASGGFDLHWLADRSDPSAPRLIELAAGPTGTRVETVFPGLLGERLAWASDRGRLELPGAPAATSRNLYH